MLALDDVESADAGADVDARALGHLFVFDLVVGGVQRLVGGGNGEMNEAAHLARFLLLDELQGVEVLDFGCNLAGKLRSIEAGNAFDPALAGEQSLPDFFVRYDLRRKSARLP